MISLTCHKVSGWGARSPVPLRHSQRSFFICAFCLVCSLLLEATAFSCSRCTFLFSPAVRHLVVRRLVFLSFLFFSFFLTFFLCLSPSFFPSFLCSLFFGAVLPRCLLSEKLFFLLGRVSRTTFGVRALGFWCLYSVVFLMLFCQGYLFYCTVLFSQKLFEIFSSS